MLTLYCPDYDPYWNKKTPIGRRQSEHSLLVFQRYEQRSFVLAGRWGGFATELNGGRTMESNKRYLLSRRATGLVLYGAMAAASLEVGHAQNAPSADQAAPNTESIVVTGSQIRQDTSSD